MVVHFIEDPGVVADGILAWLEVYSKGDSDLSKDIRMYLDNLEKESKASSTPKRTKITKVIEDFDGGNFGSVELIAVFQEKAPKLLNKNLLDKSDTMENEEIFYSGRFGIEGTYVEHSATRFTIKIRELQGEILKTPVVCDIDASNVPGGLGRGTSDLFERAMQMDDFPWTEEAKELLDW